jgi:hypothetical protein
MRQPVIENVLLNPPIVTVRSRRFGIVAGLM